MKLRPIWLVTLMVCAPLLADDRWLMVGGAEKTGTDFSMGADVRSTRTLFFTAVWCPPCKSVKEKSFPTLKAAGWTIGSEPSNHVQVIDADENPDLMEEFEVKTLPTWVRVRGGKVLEQRSGLMDGRTAGFWMRGETETVPVERSQTQPKLPIRQRSFLFWSW